MAFGAMLDPDEIARMRDALYAGRGIRHGQALMLLEAYEELIKTIASEEGELAIRCDSIPSNGNLGRA